METSRLLAHGYFGLCQCVCVCLCASICINSCRILGNSDAIRILEKNKVYPFCSLLLSLSYALTHLEFTSLERKNRWCFAFEL